MEPVPKPINISSATTNGDRHKVPKQASCEVKVCIPVPPVTAHRHQVPGASSGTHRHKCQEKPPVRLKRASLHPQVHIGIKCQEKPPVRLKRPSLHPQAHIGIKCQEKPPVRLKRPSLHPQAHIGMKCQEKPPVRLKSVSSCAQPSSVAPMDLASGARPEEEPQGFIWSLTRLGLT